MATRRRLPNLRALNPAKPKPTAAEEDRVEILIYDFIDFYGVNATDIVGLLNIITAEEIDVRINSYGGDVFEGVAIFNALRRHKSKIIVHIDGIAASIASLIALAGDEIRIARNGFLMVHHPWTFAMGNKHDLRQIADDLEKIGDSAIRAQLVERSGESEAVVEKWLDEETWFNADEAIEADLADVIDDESDEEVEVSDRIVKLFSKMPEALRARGSKEPQTKRQLERALRDAGLGRAAAKAFVAGGFRELESQRDADASGLHNSIRQMITTLSS